MQIFDAGLHTVCANPTFFDRYPPVHCPGLVPRVWAFKGCPRVAYLFLIRSMNFKVRLFLRVPLFPLKLENR